MTEKMRFCCTFPIYVQQMYNKMYNTKKALNIYLF